MISLLMAAALMLGQDAPPDEPHAGAGEAQAEVQALVDRIKRTLSSIDDALFEVPDADDVGVALSDVAAAHEQAVRDLEELIRQARYSQSQQSGGGGGGGGGGGQDQPRNQPPPRQSDGSQSPDQPQPQPGGGQEEEPPQEGGAQPEQGEQPEQGSPQGAEPGVDRAGGPPPPDPLSDPTRSDTDGRWGLLPPKVQERLQNLHIDDVPARYRDWLGAYVRALSAVEQEEGGR